MTDQYSTPTSDVLSKTAPDANYHYIGFWARLVASILDNIWMTIVLLIVVLILAQFGLLEFSLESTSAMEVILQILMPFAMIMYLWNRYASTPGKMVFKAKILDADTFEPVPPGRFVLRYLGYIVSLLPLCLGFLWVAFDNKKQGFHDKIARTVVVREE